MSASAPETSRRLAAQHDALAQVRGLGSEGRYEEAMVMAAAVMRATINCPMRKHFRREARGRRLWQHVAEAYDRQRHDAEQQAELARLAAKAQAASRRVRAAARRRYRALARFPVLTVLAALPVAAWHAGRAPGGSAAVVFWAVLPLALLGVQRWWVLPAVRRRPRREYRLLYARGR